jgi:hypothetical protein
MRKRTSINELRQEGFSMPRCHLPTETRCVAAPLEVIGADADALSKRRRTEAIRGSAQRLTVCSDRAGRAGAKNPCCSLAVGAGLDEIFTPAAAFLARS